MGLETSPQNPLGRIDPGLVVPRIDPASSGTLATTAMIEAFRNGQISANDIADRAMKRPAVEAAVATATDPEILAAQKQSVVAKGQVDVLAAQKAQELSRIPEGVLPYYQEVVKARIFPPVNLKNWNDTTTQQVVKAFSDLSDFHKEAAKAKIIGSSVASGKTIDPATKQEFEGPISGATREPLDRDAVQSVADWALKYGNDPAAWIKDGKQPVHEDLFSAPGTAITKAAYIPGTLPTDEAAAPLAIPENMKARLNAPSRGRMVGLPPEEKSPTQQQAQAGMFVARALGADEVFKNLEKAGFDPGSTKNWAQDLLIGPLSALKSADRRSYDAAKNEWSQGLLRLESGAAISNKEQKWYENTFFPTGLEPKAVQNQKARMRADVEAIANQMAKTGHLDVPALLNVESRADLIHDLTTGGALSGKSLSVVKIGGRSGRLDNSDPANPKIIWDTPAPASKSYVPPISLRQTNVTVEPK